MSNTAQTPIPAATAPDMAHEFEVKVDAAMMKAAWRAWFFRGRKLGRLALAALMVIGGVALEPRRGGLGTLSVMGLTALGLLVVLLAGIYWNGLRRSLSKLEAITDGKAAYRLTDTAIEARSSLGSVSLAWPAIAELRSYRGLVLLGFRGAMYSIIPADQIPAPALAFLIEKCRSAGAGITGF